MYAAKLYCIFQALFMDYRLSSYSRRHINAKAAAYNNYFFLYMRNGIGSYFSKYGVARSTLTSMSFRN
jgi:hypothetical protein